MKRKQRHIVIIAWVLLSSLITINIVKATHFHDVDEVTASSAATPGHSHSSDNGDSCPICHFLLTPYIKAPTSHFYFFAELISCLIVLPCADIKQENRLLLSLRAPPSAI